MRKKYGDLTGQMFGRWTVLKKGGMKNGKRVYLCQCECGAQHEVRYDRLVNGESTQCTDCARRRNARQWMMQADPEEVKAYLRNHTVKDTMLHYKVSKGGFYAYLDRNGIPRPGNTGRCASAIFHSVKTPKTKPEVVAKAREVFNRPLTPQLIEGVNFRSPHEDRRWHYSGQEYLNRLNEYERMVHHVATDNS